MEDMLSFAREHAHIVTILKIDDTNWACLAANRFRYRVGFCMCNPRRTGPWASRRDVCQLIVVVVWLIDPARTGYVCSRDLYRF
jgi:hypothetical protein